MNTATVFDRPEVTDGMLVHTLVQHCPPLDTNSSYCNLLQCSHFADTCITAKRAGELIGFISGYRLPNQPHTLFIWQVAVSSDARGCGLASQMLLQLLARPSCQGVQQIETTITSDNAGSWALFTKLAKQLDAPLTRHTHFERDTHFAGQHDSELLARIGPISSATCTANTVEPLNKQPPPTL
ncbi:diaminobutyrate acetyltransferase [Marinagarivorans algicola]|uniref:diaminobutyrate acetyltransferase n=1 Tax=Marinagarivorans algicola TaxID=1513270 RepID=UPI0006B51EAF|nr:diaminobutyrate acetyltransferase [Marinagarivorans algicola]